MATSTAQKENAIVKILKNMNISMLKDEQRIILNCLLERRDCLAVLPTGYGKSLPYQIFIPVQRELEPAWDGKIVVCSPLISLMKDQVERLSRITGVNAAYKGSSAVTDKQILNGAVDIIFASPETLVGNEEWRSAMQTLKISVIVVDEFHTIATWGEDSDGTQKKAFRKWFAYIGELRSLWPNATVLALSATCTLKIRERVMKVLTLKQDTVEVISSPNKNNIKLVVSKIVNCIEMAMSWLVDGLTERKEEFPRTIIYCTSITDISRLYLYLNKELPNDSQYYDMFHSETSEAKKEQIINALKEPNSNLRVILATSALGMGIDVIDCNCVILYGAPKTTVELIQEIGRVGRDGSRSVAVLLYNSHHLRKVESEVKEVFKTSECRRMTLMKPFLKPSSLEGLKMETGVHACCDNCAAKCECGHCDFLTPEKIFYALEEESKDGSDSDSSSEDTELYSLSEDDMFVSLALDFDEL